MLELKVSETFRQRGAVANVTYPGKGVSPIPSDTPMLSIRYDAETRSYAIEEGSRSGLFRPEDVVATDMRGRVYRRADGAITETLALSQPGDSGPFTYRYVGSAAWLRTENANGVINHRATTFAYGVRTPDAAMPRTGNATFSIVLNGFIPMDEALAGFDGAGLLNADFAARTWKAGGVTRIGMPTSNNAFIYVIDGTFSADGYLAREGSSLSGTISFDYANLRGALNGSFYGPQAEEVGASFLFGDGKRQASGTLIGRRGTEIPVLETLEKPLSPLSLQQFANNLNYSENSDGTYRDATLDYYTQSEILYRADPRSYNVGAGIVYDPSNRVASESNDRFTVYRAKFVRNNKEYTRTFTTYNIGTGNAELALSYLTFGQDIVTRPDNTRYQAWLAFGIETHPNALPRTGTGNYTGVVYGSAIGSGSAADRYALTGTTGLQLDFAAQTFTGSMTLDAANLRTGVTDALGNYTFSPILFPGRNMTGNVLTADITGIAGATGRLNAHMFGTTGEEIGGTFALVTPGAGTVLTATGALAATRR